MVLSPSSSVWRYHRRHHQCGVITVVIISVVLSPSSVWCYHHHHQCGVITVIISVVLSPSSSVWCYHRRHHQCGVITVITNVVLSLPSSVWGYHRHHHHQCGIITVIIHVALSPSSSMWCYHHRHHQCGVITMNLNHLHPTKLSVSAACCLSPSLARKKEYQFTMFQLVNLSPIQYFACIHVQQF